MVRFLSCFSYVRGSTAVVYGAGLCANKSELCEKFFLTVIIYFGRIHICNIRIYTCRISYRTQSEINASIIPNSQRLSIVLCIVFIKQRIARMIYVWAVRKS